MIAPTDKSKRIAAAIALAAGMATAAEGLRQIAYRDPASIITVCYGHTGTDFKTDVRYSLAQCDEWLSDDMKKAITAVDTCVPGLPGNVLAAFGDAAFNIGPKIACDTERSTAARYLKSGHITAACLELPKWDKARVAGVLIPLPGLTKRRQREMALCLS